MLCFCLLVCCSFSLHGCLCIMYTQCWRRSEDSIRSTHELQMVVSCHFSTKIWTRVLWKATSALNCWTCLSSSCLECSLMPLYSDYSRQIPLVIDNSYEFSLSLSVSMLIYRIMCTLFSSFWFIFRSRFSLYIL